MKATLQSQPTSPAHKPSPSSPQPTSPQAPQAMEKLLVQNLHDVMRAYCYIVWHEDDTHKELLQDPVNSIIKTIKFYLETCDSTKFMLLSGTIVCIEEDMFKFTLFPSEDFENNFLRGGEGFVTKEILEAFKQTEMYKKNSHHIKQYCDHHCIYDLP